MCLNTWYHKTIFDVLWSLGSLRAAGQVAEVGHWEAALKMSSTSASCSMLSAAWPTMYEQAVQQGPATVD